jgi:hypothetical protein
MVLAAGGQFLIVRAIGRTPPGKPVASQV